MKLIKIKSESEIKYERLRITDTEWRMNYQCRKSYRINIDDCIQPHWIIAAKLKYIQPQFWLYLNDKQRVLPKCT